MACRDAKIRRLRLSKRLGQSELTGLERLVFGVDSAVKATTILQNNLTEFEWVSRNKIYPAFWGRYFHGENAVTKEEIDFIHRKACKIAPIFVIEGGKELISHGKKMGEKICSVLEKYNVPKMKVVFLEIKENEEVTQDFMRGYAEHLMSEGYFPAFKANTDAKYTFDREFGKGMQKFRNVFGVCYVWATAPSLKEYDRVTTTHNLHPDFWRPYAPSAITRNDIAIWQYGKECHPIFDDMGNFTSFNVNLVSDEEIIIEKMF